MKRILIFGMCPLPTENETHTLGPGKRTWQFAQALLHEGHRICLVCSRHLAAYKNVPSQPIMAEEHGNLIYYSLNQQVFEDINWIQTLHNRFEPDCIIAATVYPSYIASQLKTDCPIWADLFGHMMAEAQTKSFVFDDDYYLSHMWQLEQQVLARADVFSVVSSPQSYATIGELGTQGRLNKATTGYQFVHTIPCAIDESLRIDSGKEEIPLRGKLWEKDDFVILWSGGYNTWTDVKTMFTALEMAFSANPKIKFVSTGGQIESHDELTYNQFQAMIETSKFKDRFILKGWVPFSQVPAYWRNANLGINIDLFTYEAILGSRNRILDWMQAGLPLVTSELCELSYILKKYQLGFTFRPERADRLAELLIQLAEQPGILEETAERAKEYVYRAFTPMETTQPLRSWVKSPQSAPDRGVPHKALELLSNRRPMMLSHYWASIRNQIRANGLAGALRWFSSRYINSFRGR
jgi:glycosyltransferase involved in cell wall biosynthesis